MKTIVRRYEIDDTETGVRYQFSTGHRDSSIFDFTVVTDRKTDRVQFHQFDALRSFVAGLIGGYRHGGGRITRRTIGTYTS